MNKQTLAFGILLITSATEMPLLWYAVPLTLATILIIVGNNERT